MSDISQKSTQGPESAQILPFTKPERRDNSMLGAALRSLEYNDLLGKNFKLSTGQQVQICLDCVFWVVLEKVTEIEEISLTQLIERIHAAQPAELDLNKAVMLSATAYTTSFLETSLEVIEDILFER